MFKTRINIAVLTNITPDHLDRYENDVKKYSDSKFRITQNQKKEDAFIYCLDDEITSKEMRERKFNAELFPFSIKKKMEQGAYVKGKNLIINTNHNKLSMFLEE